MKGSEATAGIPLMEDADSERDDGSVNSLDFMDESVKFTARVPPRMSLRTQILQWTKRKPVLIMCGAFVAIICFSIFGSYDWRGYSSGSRSHPLRPSVHFAAPIGTWLNDPNGLFVDGNGTWHMYYQHLYSPAPGAAKNWAHATSKDLYSWTVHGVPLEATKEQGIWSGSAVIDRENESGFFPEGQKDGIVAIYTQHGINTGIEAQSIAYSANNGFDFQLYKKNPVLAHGKESYDFRDPKVFWYEKTKRWIMVVSVAAQQRVEIYLSTNLVDWKFSSAFSNPFLSDEHPSFECPNLIEMPVVNVVEHTGFPNATTQSSSQATMWMLTLSSGSGHPGYTNGGSVVRYFPGEFNGTHFTPIDSRTDRLLDFGPDFYATQFWHNAPAASGPVSISWAANLQDCDDVETGEREHWRGMMTLPRKSMLMLTKDGDVRYLSEPVGLDAMRGKELVRTTLMNSNYSLSLPYNGVQSGALIIDLKLSLTSPIPQNYAYDWPAPRMRLSFESSVKSDTLSCDFILYKGGPHFNCAMADGSKKMVTPVPRFNGENGLWEIQLIIDHSILEVYLNRGLRVGTMTMWPKKPYETLKFEMEGWSAEVGTTQMTVQELIAPQITLQI